MYTFGQYWPWMKLLNNIVYYIVFVFKSLFSRARGIKLSMNNGKKIFFRHEKQLGKELKLRIT